MTISIIFLQTFENSRKRRSIKPHHIRLSSISRSELYHPCHFTAHLCAFFPPTIPCVLSYCQLKLAICIFVCLLRAGHLLHDTLESIGTANAAYGNASKKRECASTYTLLCHKWTAIAVCRAAPTHSCRVHSTSGH